MGSGEIDRPQKRGRRYAIAAIGVVGAFGIYSAIGTNIVNSNFPSISEWITGSDSLRVNVQGAVGANDGFALATWSPGDIEGQLDGVDGCESLAAVAEEVHAARVGTSFTDLVIEGSTHRDVTIVDLRPEIVDRGPAMDGAEIHCASAGAVAGIGVSFDFDEPDPVARRVSEDEKDGLPYFEKGDVITLKEDEIQSIQIESTSTRDYVAWNLVANLVIDGDSQTITIDENGQPFQITAGPPEVDFARYYEWLWFENPQRLYVSREPFSP
jgi:hypothetical protein